MSLSYEPLSKHHYPGIIQIIKEVWHYEDFTTPKVAQQLARAFFYSCLTDYTYAQVAILDNQPVGVILVKQEEGFKSPLLGKMTAAITQLPLLLSKEGRLHASVYNYVETIDEELLALTQTSYEGQMTLFAVSEKAQGHGIGKQLFQFGIETFKKEQINNFYLFTDTTCNYGFYDHQGMTVQVQKDHHFTQLPNTPPTTFFLYADDVSN